MRAGADSSEGSSSGETLAHGATREPAAAAQEPDVSVVVVTHNNESLIAACLRAVARSVRRHSYEVGR
jgi:hypothetical protein